MKEIIHPTSNEHWLRLRARNINSTEASALLDASPYQTLPELWYSKFHAEVVSIDPNERMKWGNRLQDAIAMGIAEDNGMTIRPMKEYIQLSDIRMGSSFDYAIQEAMPAPPNGDPVMVDIGLLEIKNVDSLQFKEGWIEWDDGEIEAPLHIEIQVQYQLAVSGLAYAVIGVLVGGNTVKLLKRQRDEQVIHKLKLKVQDFWSSINANKPPRFDFARDAELISSLYGYASPNKIKDADDKITAVIMKYREASDEVKVAQEKKDAAKAELLTLIGDAEKVTGKGFTISAGMIGPTSYQVNREGYRNFRVSWKKNEGKEQ